MAVEIRRHCQALVDLINDRDWTLKNPSAKKLIKDHISTDFQARLDQYAHTLTFAEEIEFWRQMTIDHPNTHFELVGVDTVVHKESRTADAVMRTIMSRENMTLFFACELKWKFTSGRWLWTSQHGMRGAVAPL